MDFEIEVISSDESARTLQVCMRPDPRRYDKIEHEGVPHYFDKYLQVLFPEDLMLGEGAWQLSGLPIYHLSASIRSTKEYAAARRSALAAELEGAGYVAPAERAIPHRSALENVTPRELVFLSVDICGGSALRRSGRGKFDQAYAIFMRELGTLVGQFNGTIYKPTGDGFIACIDHPSFNSRSDQAVDLGTSLLRVLDASVNPALRQCALPEFQIRIGADTGPVAFRKIEIPATGFTDIEIASDALNRSVKLQEAAQPNQFLIGRDLYELIHVEWLDRAAEVPFDGAGIGMPGYRAYGVS